MVPPEYQPAVLLFDETFHEEDYQYENMVMVFKNFENLLI
jgi:hypothetical protein